MTPIVLPDVGLPTEAQRLHARAHQEDAPAGENLLRPREVLRLNRHARQRWSRVTTILSRFAHPHVRLLGRRWSSYQLFGYSGILLGTLTAGWIGQMQGHRAMQLLALWLSVVVAAVIQILLGIVLTGRDRLVFLRFWVASLVIGAVVYAWLGASPAMALDLLAVGFGVVQAFGRIGCWMAGCCHGRPGEVGVIYGDRAGLPHALRPLPLLPVQGIESLWIALCTGVAAGLAVSGNPPGAAFVAFVAGYAPGRFVIEYFRGDVHRTSLAGLTEAQWITLGVAFFLPIGMYAGLLPGSLPLAWILPGVLAALGIAGQGAAARHPHDLVDLARVLDTLDAGDAIPTRNPAAIHLLHTRNGMRLSRTPRVDGVRTVYALSALRGDLSTSAARRLARSVFRLRPEIGEAVLLKARSNLYFVVCTPAENRPHPSPFR